MRDETVRRVRTVAVGLGEAMTKDAEAVRQLVTVSGGDVRVLERALEHVEAQAGGDDREPTTGTSAEGAPEAPALLAVRLLREAIAEVRGESDTGLV